MSASTASWQARQLFAPASLATGVQSISNPAPFVGSFTPDVDGPYEVGVTAGSFVSGGGGALRIVLRLSSGPGGTSYPGDVFNSDAFPPTVISTPVERVFGSVNLTAGVTYGLTLGGGGGTTGGMAEAFVRPV